MKGIGFFEQHVEKIILTVTVLVLAIAFYTQFIREPHSIPEGSPQEIKTKVESEIESLNRRLNGNANVPNYEVAGFDEHFEQTTIRNAPGSGLATGVIGNPPIEPPIAEGGGETYSLPRPPMATGFEVAAGHALLATSGNQGEITQQLIDILDQRAPYDFQYVSVAADFPFAQWVRRLEQRRSGQDPPVPTRWWGSRRFLAGVLLQRQELDPVTGEWSDPVIIDPMPGQIGYRENAEQVWEPGEFQQTLSLISNQQQFVQQPPFVPTAGGVPWTPPGEGLASLSPETQLELRGLFDDLEGVRDRIFRMEERNGNARTRTDNSRSRSRTTTNRRSTGGGMGAAGGAFGGNNAARRTPAPTRSRDQNLSPLDRLRNQEVEIINEIMAILLPDQAEQQNNQPVAQQPGFNQPGMMQPGFNPGMRGNNTAQPVQSAGITEDEVRVWAHDITVEPGKTYRYRVIVNVLNPLFRRSNINKQQRAENYRKIALGPDPDELESSPWSRPITTDPVNFFWLVDGSLQNQQAEVEIWTRYSGQWERLESRVSAGDAIGGNTNIEGPMGITSLRMYTGQTMVDYASLGAGAASAALLFIDDSTGQLDYRTVEGDAENVNYVRLLNEMDAIAFLQEVGAGGNRGGMPGMGNPGMGNPGMGGMPGGPMGGEKF